VVFTKTERQILQILLDNINSDFAQARKHCVDLEKSLQKLREWKENYDEDMRCVDNANADYIERVGAGV